MLKNLCLILFIVMLIVNANRAEQLTIFDSRQDWTKHTFVKTTSANNIWTGFAKGDLYVRYQIIDKPSSIEVFTMLCFWHQKYLEVGAREDCTPHAVLARFKNEGTYYAKYPGPANSKYWNNIWGPGFNENEDIRAILHQWWVKKAGETRWKVLRAGEEKMDYGSGIEAHIPIDFYSTGILVKQGHTLVPPKNWGNCPNGWGCSAPVQQTPYKGLSHWLPVRIQVEDYDEGGEGVAYHDETATNTYKNYRFDDVEILFSSREGENIVIASGSEWLEYTVDVSPGTYNLHLRVASSRAGGNRLVVKLGGSTLANIDIPVTGSINIFETVKISGINISSGGNKILRVEMSGDLWSFNWLEFVDPNTTAIKVKDKITHLPSVIFRLSNGGFDVSFTGAGPHVLSIYELNGKELIKLNGYGSHIYSGLIGELPEGIYVAIYREGEITKQHLLVKTNR